MLGTFLMGNKKSCGNIWWKWKKVLPLQHENPPSLSTMLKSAGRFIILWLDIQNHIRHQPNWYRCCYLVDFSLRMQQEQRIIFAISAITDSALIFILFWQHQRKIMFSSLASRSIKPWTCIVLTDICGCWCSTKLRRSRWLCVAPLST